jgi:GT2 family glycosyltransferase
LTIGFVAIGRNEGERLVACLRSLRAQSEGPIVYVDSGSTDGSAAAAEREGAIVVALDLSIPFTAARARNAGAARLGALHRPDLIQFIDGDCTLEPGWLAAAEAFLADRPEVAAVCGRRRERRPEASVYNRLCDIEWDTPVGAAAACGGDVLVRADALSDIGGYRDELIAGEEPEMCLRLRERGWLIWRLDAPMTTHDAAITRFGQWWTRCRRAGHAFAEISTLHRRSPCRIWAKETRRALVWSAAAPVFALAALVEPWFAAGLLIYPAQFLRLWAMNAPRRGGDAAFWALMTVICRFAEAAGALDFHLGSLRGRRAPLFEYK